MKAPSPKHVDVSVAMDSRNAVGYLVTVNYTDRYRKSATATQFVHATRPQGSAYIAGFDIDYVNLTSITILALEPVPNSSVTVTSKQLR